MHNSKHEMSVLKYKLQTSNLDIVFVIDENDGNIFSINQIIKLDTVIIVSEIYSHENSN